MQSWCRIWPPNGSSRIRAKPKLLRKYKGACKSSWSPIGSLKSFTLTIPWNLAKLVKICPGIIVRRQHTDRKQMGLPKETVLRVKECTSAALLQSGLDANWCADSMECHTRLRNIQDLLSDGKTQYERRFGKPFKGPIIPFGSFVDYHPISAKDQSRIHQFGKKGLPGLFLGYALYAGGIWKGDMLVADIEELETMDASEVYSKRLNAKEVILPKQGEFIFSNRRWTNQTSRRRSGTENIHLDTGTPISRRRSRRFSWRIRRVSFTTSSAEIDDFWSMSGSFIYRHHVRT